MTHYLRQSTFFVALVTTKFRTMREAMNAASQEIAAHIARSKVMHDRGELLMGGAFLDSGDQDQMTTMGILTSRQAAEEYLEGDPLVLAGMVESWSIREWANMLAPQDTSGPRGSE